MRKQNVVVVQEQVPVQESAEVPQREQDLPQAVKEALGEVRQYRLAEKGGLWAEAQSVLCLKTTCDENNLKYQKVAEKYLSDEGGAFSSARISMLLGAARYLEAKKIDVPKEVTAFPSIYHVHPLVRFLDKPTIAEKKKTAWVKLHDQVFGPDKNRPSVDDVRKQVGRLFAPPGPRLETNKKPPAMREVNKDGLNAWFGVVAPKGTMTIAEVRVSVPSPSGIAAALRANWKLVSKASLVKIVKVK